MRYRLTKTDRDVCFHPVYVFALGNHRDSSLDGPAEHNLGVCCQSVRLRNGLDSWVDVESRIILTYIIFGSDSSLLDHRRVQDKNHSG